MRRRRTNNTLKISTNNPFVDKTTIGTINTQDNVYEEALVVDVITNDSHPDYSADGFNVGSIKCRLLQSQWFDSDNFISSALPLEANISQYPLINEVVFVIRVLSKLYYFPKINISNKVTAQPFFGLSEETSAGNSGEPNHVGYEKSTAIANKNTTNPDFTLGKVFKENTVVHRLRHMEGDVVIEGRSGHSIHFGMNPKQNQAPNILLRSGQDPNAKLSVASQFGLVSEDINNDLSSIWITTNELVPIKLSTENTTVHFKSLVNPPTNFGGSQVVMNSGQIILNSKINDIFLNTFLGLHLTSGKDTTIDVNNDFISFVNNDYKLTINGQLNITTGKTVSLAANDTITISSKGRIAHTSKDVHTIQAKKIYIGSAGDESQPMVLGEELRGLLENFVDAHLSNAASYVMTPTGPGNLLPGVVSALQRIKAELDRGKQASFMSQNNFVTKTNQ